MEQLFLGQRDRSPQFARQGSPAAFNRLHRSVEVAAKLAMERRTRPFRAHGDSRCPGPERS